MEREEFLKIFITASSCSTLGVFGSGGVGGVGSVRLGEVILYNDMQFM